MSRKFVRYDTAWPIKKARFAISCVTPSTTSDGINFFNCFVAPTADTIMNFLSVFEFYPARLLQDDPILRIIQKCRKHKIVALLNQFRISATAVCMCVCVEERRNSFLMIRLHKIGTYIPLVYLSEKCER